MIINNFDKVHYMATDYSLNLKAHLDVTELEQQLNSLRAQMTQFRNNLTGRPTSGNNAQIA